MLNKYKSISLMNKDSKYYRDYLKSLYDNRNINKGESEPDPKYVITKWAEDCITQLLSSHYKKIDKNILTWMELNSYGIYNRRFRELDGLFEFDGKYIYLEVKASQSKSNYRRGKSQINANLSMINLIRANTVGVLCMLDCRCFDNDFGFYEHPETIENPEIENIYKVLRGLTLPLEIDHHCKYYWLISESETNALGNKYGEPVDINS